MVASADYLAEPPDTSKELPPEIKVPDTTYASWLTREQSARLLGVSVQTVKNYERRKLLDPQRTARRIGGRDQLVVVHDPQALVALNAALKSKGKNADEDNVTSGWLTRNQSADMLRVSIQTLKNYEHQDKLHPRRVRREDARGHEQVVVVYDPTELARVPRGIGRFSPREAGEIQALSFEMFEQGKSFREIVIALRETSDTIHELYECWLNDGGSRVVISDAARSALEALLGPFETVTDLVDLVTAKINEP